MSTHSASAAEHILPSFIMFQEIETFLKSGYHTLVYLYDEYVHIYILK